MSVVFWGIAILFAVAALGKAIRRKSARVVATHPRVLNREFICGVHGESHDNDDGSSRQKIIAKCRAGDRVGLVPQPDNPFDCDAVRVVSAHGQIGFIPAPVAMRLVEQLREGFTADATIERIGHGPDTPNAGVWLTVKLGKPA